MEHLTTLDAGFLKAEDSDRHVSLAIGAVAIIDGPPPDYNRLKAALAERIRAIPRCTQVLRMHPFDMGPPEWVDDPGFDLNHHIRRVALPRPRDDAELFRVVADVLERRLDRDRPLWECWVIEDLKGNQWAILMKIHHCVVDGISTTHLLTRLSDDADGDLFVNHHGTKQTSTSRTYRPSVPGLNPLNWADNLWRASGVIINAAAWAAAGAAELAAGLIRPAGASSLSGPVTTMRRYTAVRVPLAAVDNVCRKFGVTVNDVALAAITEGFRTVMLHRGEQPRPDSLRTLVPISVRSADAIDTPDNRLSIMLPYLPVEQDDPVQRLRTVHSRLTRTKHSGQRQAGRMFVSAANHIPFMVSAWAIRLLTRLPQRGIVTLTTNVPGPRHRLQMMGHQVIRVLPITPIALGLRTGIAVLSYADDLVFGITADYDGAPDVDELANGIELAVARLEALTQDSVLLFGSDARDDAGRVTAARVPPADRRPPHREP